MVMKTFDNADEELVAYFLQKNAVVAVFQGRAEAGPRALGNRSLLWNAELFNGKTRLNLMKKREMWRPFAGVILEEAAADWFDMKGMKSSPFMSYAVRLKEGLTSEQEGSMYSIIHNDGTCRIQTVNEDQNPVLYNIIKEYSKSLSGFPPILGNTSFNRAGEPLIHTRDQALEALESDFIEYLYLPDEGKLLFSPNV
tara:strand:- start:11319 stop:11909 length:591 start_codon:yes stop_codon:yes gene_type:complete